MRIGGELRSATERSRSPNSSGSPQDKYLSKAQEYIEKLTTNDALTGVKIGQEVHQARRLLAKVEEGGGNACEAVALRSHINVLSQCVALDVNKLATLKPGDRQKKMEALCPHLRTFLFLGRLQWFRQS